MNFEQALENSGLDINLITDDQKSQIFKDLKDKKIPYSESNNLGCIACKVALKVIIAVPIGALIAAGTLITPELAVIGTISSLFGGVASIAVVNVINDILKTAKGEAIDEIILALCTNFGACK